MDGASGDQFEITLWSSARGGRKRFARSPPSRHGCLLSKDDSRSHRGTRSGANWTCAVSARRRSDLFSLLSCRRDCRRVARRPSI